MNNKQAQIEPFEYKGGKDFTDRLLNVTGATNLVELSDLLNVPRTTISTWHRRNMTPYEIVVRVCISTGSSIKYLALGEGEPFEEHETVEETAIALNKEKIVNGVLTPSNEMKFDQSLLDYYELEADQTKLIEAGPELLMVNTAETNPTSGRYLIDIDGSVSINQIQRLPGKKLAMSFDDSSIEVAEGDIKVLGRVVMTMAKA